MIRPKRGSGLAVLATMALLAALGGSLPATGAPPQRGLDAAITGVLPLVLTQDSTANVVVLVTNRSAAPIEGATLQLAAQGWTPSTRVAVSRWLESSVFAASIPLAAAALPRLEPGASAEVRFAVPAADFRFTTWGARGIEVTVVPPDGGGAIERDRSWVVWWNQPQITPLPTGFLAPVTPTVAELAARDGWQARYDAVLAQGALPGVTLLMDPAPLAMDPAAEEREAVAARLAAAHDVWALPLAFTDSAAVLAANRRDLAESAVADSLDLLEELGVTPEGTVEGSRDPGRDVAAVSAGPLLLTPAAVKGWYETGTPSANVLVGGRRALVLDRIVEEILGGVAQLDGMTYNLSTSQQTQLLAATTAAMLREAPATTRTLFAALPASDDGHLAQLLSATAALPWIAPITLGGADEYWVEARELGRAILPATQVLPAGAITGGEIAQIAALDKRFLELSQVVAQPAELRSPAIAALDMLTGRAWQEAPALRTAQLATSAQAVDALDRSLRVITPSRVLIVSESSKFPVTLANTLPAPANVVVSLEATDLRLQQVRPLAVTIPANSEIRAEIPVTAVGSGDLTVNISLATPAGHPIGGSQAIEVQMRADWENFGLVTLIFLGLLLLILGVIRTVLRNLRGDRAAVMGAAVEEFSAQLDAEDAVARRGPDPADSEPGEGQFQ